MNPRISWLLLKRLLLLFWAVWFTLVVASNVADGLKVAGLLSDSLVFNSGNYAAILKVAEPFGVPTELVGFLFVGVIGWESLSTVLFWYTGLTFQGASDRDRQGRNQKLESRN